MASTKLKTSVIAAVLVASVLTPLLVQRQAQATLREQDDAWRTQSNQLAQLTADNQRLADLLARAKSARPLTDSELRELMRLLGEVGRLKSNVQEMKGARTATPQSPEDKIASLAKMYAARADRLKQWLKANPSENIPEFKSLTDDDWLQAAQTLKDDATENDYERAMRIMRSNAEGAILSQLQQALRGYAQANSGQFPPAFHNSNLISPPQLTRPSCKIMKSFPRAVWSVNCNPPGIGPSPRRPR
jgi:uncharacterized membrane protein YdfJ with MMPL/SSD domain